MGMGVHWVMGGLKIVGYNMSFSWLAMKCLLFISAVATTAAAFLTAAMANPSSDFFPEKCVLASKPTKCMVNSFGVKRNTQNDFEIYYPGGVVGIRFGKSGAVEGGNVFVNNVPGTIQVSHGGEASAALTIITEDGKVYSFTYGD